MIMLRKTCTPIQLTRTAMEVYEGIGGSASASLQRSFFNSGPVIYHTFGKEGPKEKGTSCSFMRKKRRLDLHFLPESSREKLCILTPNMGCTTFLLSIIPISILHIPFSPCFQLTISLLWPVGVGGISSFTCSFLGWSSLSPYLQVHYNVTRLFPCNLFLHLVLQNQIFLFLCESKIKVSTFFWKLLQWMCPWNK